MTTEAILMIMRGIRKTPADALSAEVGLDSINLLDITGFSQADYEMQFPALKSGGLWADATISDGRTLMTGAMGNVSETVRLELTSGTLIQMAALMSKLNLFVRYCHEYWSSFAQNEQEPVYLKHQVAGEPGERYALLYDISVAETPPLTPDTPQRIVTISIEREPYWRWGVAPGENPKRWYIENVAVGQKWTADKASLISGGDHLVSGLIDNCQEFLTTTTFQSRNFLDIPADKLPGDAPPLVCITADSPFGFSADLHIAVSTNRTSITDRNSSPLPLYNSFPLSGSSLQSGTAVFTTDNTWGIAHVPVSALKRTVVVTPVNASEVNIALWSASATFSHLNPLVLRGRYVVYLRGCQVGGTAGQTTARLIVNATQGELFNSGLMTLPLSTVARAGLIYMGVLTLPIDDHSPVGMLGKGYTAEYDMQFLLSTQRSAGVSTHELEDIILMPFSEGYTVIKPALNLSADWFNIYDNTGYFTHGRPESVGMGRRSSGNNEFNALTEFSGDLQLTPGVNNRLYFLSYYTGGNGAQPSVDMTPRINIVPRSTGLRTE